MPSHPYTCVLRDAPTGAVDLDSDLFYVMVLANSYTPSKAHKKRADVVTHEVIGSGYTAGGAAVTVTAAAQDDANARVDYTLGGKTFVAQITNAQYFVYYKARGGAANLDELVAVIDAGAPITPNAANNFTLVLQSSTLRLQN